MTIERARWAWPLAGVIQVAVAVVHVRGHIDTEKGVK